MIEREIVKKKMDMYHRIIGILPEYEKQLQENEMFVKAIDELKEEQISLSSLYIRLEKDISEIEREKNSKREELIKKINHALTILQIYAFDQKKKKLKQQTNKLDVNKFNESSDLDIVRTAKKIWKIAEKQGEFKLPDLNKIRTNSLVDKTRTMVNLEKKFGLTPSSVNEIKECNIQYIESLLVYNDKIEEKKKVSRKIKKAIDRTDKLIQNKVDRFIFLYKDEQPELYKKYNEAKELNQQEEPKQEVQKESSPEPLSQEMQPDTSDNKEKPVNIRPKREIRKAVQEK